MPREPLPYERLYKAVQNWLTRQSSMLSILVQIAPRMSGAIRLTLAGIT